MFAIRSNTYLHSCGDRGGSEESTQAYLGVRRGERRSDNEGIHMKANWYKLLVVSLAVVIGLSLLSAVGAEARGGHGGGHGGGGFHGGGHFVGGSHFGGHPGFYGHGGYRYYGGFVGPGYVRPYYGYAYPYSPYVCYDPYYGYYRSAYPCY